MPFPPAGWTGAASRGNRAATQPRGCGRDARAPGGAPPPILPAPRGGTASADGRAVPLGVPSSSFVPLRGSLFFPFVSGKIIQGKTSDRQKRRTTNGHEDRWTCFAATPSRDEPTRERGRPARTTLAQPRPSLPLGSTGNGAMIPRFRFSRADGVPGGRVARRRITGKRSGHPTQRMRARRPRSRRGAPFHPSCSARRHCPCRRGRAVPLGVPSPSFVPLRGSLLFSFVSGKGQPCSHHPSRSAKPLLPFHSVC